MDSATITLIAAILAFAASIIATAVAAFNGRFGRFARERWWERRAEAYTGIIEALSNLVYYHEEHLEAFEEGRPMREDLRLEAERLWRHNYAELKKASAIGAFLVSRDVEAALQKMWRYDNRVDPQDWQGQIERELIAARDCLKVVVEHAKRDLETRIPATSAPRRVRVWKVLAGVALGIVTATAAFGVTELRRERRWPFSTGTGDVAFLGTRFGMSPQEVGRTLAGHGVPLLTRHEFQNIEPDRMLFDDFTPLFYDERGDETLYMPGIELFNAKVDAGFTFQNDRLHSISAHIDPVSADKADEVVATINNDLQAKFQAARREDSKDVPGAYWLYYSPTDLPFLWVNLTDRAKPIITLTFADSAANRARQNAIRDRQQKAFGHPK